MAKLANMIGGMFGGKSGTTAVDDDTSDLENQADELADDEDELETEFDMPEEQPPSPENLATLKKSAAEALEQTLQQLGEMAGSTNVESVEEVSPTQYEDPNGRFVPRAPRSIKDAGLTETEVEALVQKCLLQAGSEIGHRLAEQVALPFGLIETMLRRMKADQLVNYKSSMTGGDYLYELTDRGREKAHSRLRECSYFGAAPVTLNDYIAGVKAQSLSDLKPKLDDIRNAFSDISINDELLSSIGQAIHSGRGMFLYGNAGNGKTSIAERITLTFGDAIWIPRAIVSDGEIVRIVDPINHELLDPINDSSIDHRWVRIRRPTIVAGGELRMEQLEINYAGNSVGVGEAALQMKSNCGLLLIDDFGRQRMSTDELLNRWIVPLETRHDFLRLASGRTIKVPFDQLIVFSTNLEPKDLVEEAFLRRIPYKIHVTDPTEEQFRELFLHVAQQVGISCDADAVDYLMETHYKANGREMRFCHPRDILRQIENRCTLHEYDLEVTNEALDCAIQNYFSIM